jgi:hypothetical protein
MLRTFQGEIAGEGAVLLSIALHNTTPIVARSLVLVKLWNGQEQVRAGQVRRRHGRRFV